MAGLTLSRVQHHLMQVTCRAAFVSRHYVSRVSLCVRACIEAAINKAYACDERDPACLSRWVLERRREVMRSVGVAKASSPTTDVNSTASLCADAAQLMGSEWRPCAQRRPRVTVSSNVDVCLPAASVCSI